MADATFEGPDAQVTYPVRELLEQMRREQTTGFARLEVSLTQKADKSDVARMEARLDQHGKELSSHDREINSLRQKQREKELTEEVRSQHEERSSTWKRRVMGTLYGVAIVAATVIGPYIGTHI